MTDEKKPDQVTSEPIKEDLLKVFAGFIDFMKKPKKKNTGKEKWKPSTQKGEKNSKGKKRKGPETKKTFVETWSAWLYDNVFTRENAKKVGDIALTIASDLVNMAGLLVKGVIKGTGSIVKGTVKLFKGKDSEGKDSSVQSFETQESSGEQVKTSGNKPVSNDQGKGSKVVVNGVEIELNGDACVEIGKDGNIICSKKRDPNPKSSANHIHTAG